MPTYNNLPTHSKHFKGKWYRQLIEDLQRAGKAGAKPRGAFMATFGPSENGGFGQSCRYIAARGRGRGDIRPASPTNPDATGLTERLAFPSATREINRKERLADQRT